MLTAEVVSLLLGGLSTKGKDSDGAILLVPLSVDSELEKVSKELIFCLNDKLDLVEVFLKLTPNVLLGFGVPPSRGLVVAGSFPLFKPFRLWRTQTDFGATGGPFLTFRGSFTAAAPSGASFSCTEEPFRSGCPFS